MRSKFSSQENLCLQSLGSQGSYCSCTIAGQERPTGTCFQRPFCRSWIHLKNPFFSNCHSRKRSDRLCICLRSFLNTAEQIIPLLRTTHRVVFEASVVRRPQHTPRGGRSERPDRRQPRDPNSYENRSRAIDDAFHAPLDSVQLNSLIFLSALHKSFGNNPESRPRRTTIPH